MGWNRWSEWGYKPSKPREAKGGIKAKSKRGSFGTNWWAKRWVEVIESFNLGSRLQRGRTYARSGQVLSIDIENGVVSAKVQGSERKPYDIQINVAVLSEDEWSRIIDALSEQALFTAKLLSGEMPEEIEDIFQNVKLSLLPQKQKDLETYCSCPDWSNPCKHIAAVYYLIGEEFDRDPFLIFKLRGMDRERLVEQLHGAAEESVEEEPLATEPLPTNTGDFWKGGSIPDGFLGDVRVPPISAALPKRLGSLQFWKGEELLLDVIEPIYSRASAVGMGIVTGEE